MTRTRSTSSGPEKRLLSPCRSCVSMLTHRLRKPADMFPASPAFHGAMTMPIRRSHHRAEPSELRAGACSTRGRHHRARATKQRGPGDLEPMCRCGRVGRTKFPPADRSTPARSPGTARGPNARCLRPRSYAGRRSRHGGCAPRPRTTHRRRRSGWPAAPVWR